MLTDLTINTHSVYNSCIFNNKNKNIFHAIHFTGKLMWQIGIYFYSLLAFDSSVLFFSYVRVSFKRAELESFDENVRRECFKVSHLN